MTEIGVETEAAGIVSRIARGEGEHVARDEPILFVEIMKMEIPVPAPVEGKIIQLLVAQGDTVAEGQRIAIVETP